MSQSKLRFRGFPSEHAFQHKVKYTTFWGLLPDISIKKSRATLSLLRIIDVQKQ